MSLKNEFESFYKNRFGNIFLSPPVFEKFPMCVRFNIGDSEIDDDNDYIEKAITRAKTLFDELFKKDDEIYLIVDSCEKYKDLYTGDCNTIDPVRMCISGSSDESCYDKLIRQDGDSDEECPYSRYIIETSVNSLGVNSLLSQIVKSELGGNYCFSDSVYIINKNNGVLFFLYNDTGLDIVSNDRLLLTNISAKFTTWISDSKL